MQLSDCNCILQPALLLFLGPYQLNVALSSRLNNSIFATLKNLYVTNLTTNLIILIVKFSLNITLQMKYC